MLPLNTQHSIVEKMDIDIFQVGIDFYDDVYALWQQCEGMGLSDADSRQGILSYLERNPGMSFIASSRGKVVGVVLSGHDGRRGYIHHLAVHPAYRRKGLASRLVDRCLTVLADSGIQKCHLFIFNNNANGIKFWKNTGWIHRSDISVVSKNIEPTT